MVEKKVELKGVISDVDRSEVYVEFGKIQASFEMSSKGLANRKLKLKEGDKVLVTIQKR